MKKQKGRMEGIYSSLFCVIAALIVVALVILSSSIRIVPEYQRLQVYRLGHDIGQKGPGLVVVLPIIDKTVKVEVGGLPVAQTSLVGALGETQTSVHMDGQVTIAGRTWDVVSRAPIAPGRKVRVKRILLEVEEELT